MPTYDMSCTGCGLLHIDVFCTISAKDEQACDDCGATLRTVILSAPPVVGPMPSKPLRVGGIAEEFTSRRELDSYLEANQNVRIVSRSDRQWKDLKQRSRERADRMVQRAGFDDSRQYSAVAREALAKGGSPLK